MSRQLSLSIADVPMMVRPYHQKSILETLDSFFLCAVVTAEKLAISFQSMTDNAASARAAYRCHRVNCALETVERHCPLPIVT